ncbi:hypothetical protein BJ875DRAFT_385707, partial [Amylocarpus encephaloides]
KDHKEAIDQSSALDGGRTSCAKSDGSYQEPSDEDGLPGPDDGTNNYHRQSGLYRATGVHTNRGS